MKSFIAAKADTVALPVLSDEELERISGGHCVETTDVYTSIKPNPLGDATTNPGDWKADGWKCDMWQV